jgi:hypothetical protein
MGLFSAGALHLFSLSVVLLIICITDLPSQRHSEGVSNIYVFEGSRSAALIACQEANEERLDSCSWEESVS